MYTTRFLGACALIAGAVSFANAGDLNPPPGLVEPTMVSLDKIEPRICIDDLPGDASAVHIISEPGSYFLSNTIEVPAGMTGIRVELNPALAPGDYGVSIHLCEPAISGFPGSSAGVHAVAHAGGKNLRLRIQPRAKSANSLITGMGTEGIRADSILDCGISGIDIRDCGGSGLHATAATGTGQSMMRVDVLGGKVRYLKNGILFAAPSIFLSGFDEADIDGIEVHNAGGDGIVLDSIGDCTVADIDLNNIAGSGISAPNFISLAISGFSISDCFGPGITAIGTAATGKKRRIAVASLLSAAHTCERTGTGGSSSIQIFECDEVQLGTLSVIDGGGDGIELVNCAEVVFKAISTKGTGFNRVAGCAGHGISSSDCENIDLSGLTVSDCGGSGVYSTSSLTSSRYRLWLFKADRNGTSSATAGVNIEGYEDVDIEDVDISNHTGIGLRARENFQLGSISLSDTTASRCIGDGLDIEYEDAELSNVTLERNTGVGGKVSISGSLIVKGSSAKSNNSSGLQCTGATGTETVSVHDSSFLRNGFGVAPSASAGLDLANIASFTVTGGECRSNNGSGIRAADFNRDGILDRVVSSGNGQHGVHCSSPGGLPTGRVRVHDSMCDANAGSGVLLEATTGGDITDCTLTTNGGFGVWIVGGGHVVHRNTCRGNGSGPLLVPVPGNVVGPVIDELTVVGNANPAANYID
jgi:hypothetical protein